VRKLHILKSIHAKAAVTNVAYPANWGSGGTEAQHVHPLVAPAIEPSSSPAYPQNIH
jgi:hypothetical protein